MLQSNLQYLRRNQIDTQKWDRCIDNAANGLVYACSFSLDNMAANWDALVWGDYEVVMPLTWNRKWGIRYVSLPAFLQRLGIYGNDVTTKQVQMFYDVATKHFSFIDLRTATPYKVKRWLLQENTNLFIPLNRTYEEIFASYTDECKKNIKKSVSRGCRFTTAVGIEQVVDLYNKAYGHYSIKDNDHERIIQMAYAARSKEMLLCCGVTDDKTGQILQGTLLLKYKSRLYYWLGAPSEEGRKARATFFLIDQVLQQFAGSQTVFDFEGSDIPSVASFYNQFGPLNETYYTLRYNNLPWIIRWIKLISGKPEQ